MTIKFGTDGWRAIIADEFTFDNVRLVTQAIADYLHEQKAVGEIIIGFDNRFLAPEFADAAARVLTANNFTVYLPASSIPTPVAAWAVREYRAAGALMFTASHNPPAYCGLKFIPDYAGPAVPEITEAIEQKINIIGRGDVLCLELRKARQKGLVREFQPRDAYLQHLQGLIAGEVLKKARLKVIVDPLYGAGIGYLEDLLRSVGCRVDTIHNYRDPLFGGYMPDPGARGLGELIRKVKETGADLGLALDGDADRFGIVDSDGTYIKANDVLYLLAAHLLLQRQYEGSIARTVATTHNLDQLAAAHNLELIETPVGFKYIAQALIQKSCFFGGEESGGMSISGHVPEKDGILAAALVTELRAARGCSLRAVLDDLQRQFGRLRSKRTDIKVTSGVKAKVLKELPYFNPSSLVGLQVRERLLLDGIKFILTDGSWALLRISGTEPLLRLYTEAANEKQLGLMENEIRAMLNL